MTWTTATASVVLGLLLASKRLRARTGPWFLDLHRFLGGISVVFLLAHLGTLWADSYVEFGPRELLIPGASAWKTEAIAWGIVAAYLLVAVQVSSMLRSRISNRVWRGIHFTSFLAMVAGSYHAFLAGSDVENPVTWAIAGIGSLLVMGLISMRLQRKDPEDPGSAGFSDNLALLEEMRRRLEDLPIPESTPQPQINPDGPAGALPRRAPLPVDLPEIRPAPLEAPVAEAPGTIDDPFASGDVAPWADDGADLFDPAPAEPAPFEMFGAPAPANDPIGDLAPISEPTPATDLFAAALPDEPLMDMRGNPFDPVEPTPTAIYQPAPTAVPAGPPPLPEAVDPVTGEPDQAAYTEWLKEWLAYAEQYGEQTPDDPARQ